MPYFSFISWKNRFIFFIKTGIILILILVFTGCYSRDSEKAKDEFQPVDLEIENIIPEEIRNWVENSLKFDITDFANAKEFGGKQYIFVRSGTGGFIRGERLVEISDVTVAEEEVIVKVKFSTPSPAQEITPKDIYDLVYIKATGLPVRFMPIADEEIFITSIAGIHYLPDIVAQSRTIKVIAPKPNDIVGRQFSVSGIANAFEATIQYRLLDSKQNILVNGFETAGDLAHGFTREPVIPHSGIPWKYFTFDLIIPENVTNNDDLILELYEICAEQGIIVNQVAISLKFVL